MKIEKLINSILIQTTDESYGVYAEQLDAMEKRANKLGYYRYDQRASLLTYLENTAGTGKIQFYTKEQLERLKK